MAKKKIILTKRDVTTLKLLQDFGIVSTEQIGRWIFKGVSRTTVLRRLRLLEDAHYIRKRATLPNATAVWVIETDGTKVLSGIPEKEFYPAHQLPHEMALNEIRWKLYSLSVVKSWMTERSLRRKLASENRGQSRSGWLVPDALVLFQKFWKENFHARIEVELTLKSDQRYEVMIRKYHDRYSKDQVFTWYFVKSDKMGLRLLSLAKKHGGIFIDKYFGYTVIDDFLVNPWQAKLVTLGGYYRLNQLLEVKEPVNPPAQAGAQGLSTENTSKNENQAA